MGVSFAPSVEPLPPGVPVEPSPAHPPSPRAPNVAPTYAHPRRRQPPALSRPPRGLGRGRVCSIDRRRSAKLAERDRAPSWRRTPRISSFACHPLFRKSSYPLLGLCLRPFLFHSVYPRASTPRRAVLVRASHRSRQPPFEREKRERSQAH